MIGLEHGLPRSRQRQARDASWSCGNQPAYHSMINRRSVAALHRACLHRNINRKQPTPDANLCASLLKTDMTADQPFRLAQPQVVNLLDRRHRLNGRVGVGARLSPLGLRLGRVPRLQHVLRDPQRQASTLHQRSVILPPVTETISCLGLLVCHTSRIPAIRLRDYFCNKAVTPTKKNAPSRNQRNDEVSVRETSVQGRRCGADRLAVPSFHKQL